MKTNHTIYRWAVIGAGPAGIAAVGQLLDHGVSAHEIAWVDPHFAVGDFGAHWAAVSSNTSVKLFTDFLQACKSFDYAKRTLAFDLEQLNPLQTCLLKYMVEPLQWITAKLRDKVACIQDKIVQITMSHDVWQLQGEKQTLYAKQAILAIGAEPRTLVHAEVEEIPLAIALDKEKLFKACDKNDTVAVFGSSHSAIIIIRHLLEHGVHKVINFYQTPLCYAIKTEQGFLFDNTGLKGDTAIWAKANMHGQQADRLVRVYTEQANIERYLSECHKVIYAIGFERRALPRLDDMPKLNYNAHNGIIAPGLFGVGIAFPEAKVDKYGTTEYSVGLWKFMDYLQRMMPLWLDYHLS